MQLLRLVRNVLLLAIVVLVAVFGAVAGALVVIPAALTGALVGVWRVFYQLGDKTVAEALKAYARQ